MTDSAHQPTLQESVRFIARSAAPPSPRMQIRSADLRYVVRTGFYRLATALLPPDRWRAVADGVARLNGGPRKRRVRELGERFRAVYGHEVPADWICAWHRQRQARMERARLYIVAERWSDRWRPDITLNGIDLVAAALAKGKGVVLWFDDFVDHNIVAKMGLHRAGYAMHYLSSALHGPSPTAFGRRFVNPTQIAVETRYVEERLLVGEAELGGSSEVACMRRMVSVLKDNGIVGIANILTTGSRLMEAPLGASARLMMPTGAANLALQKGAALLPVATVENEPLTRYTVIVGPQIVIDGSLDKDAALASAGVQYTERLLPLVKAHPAQWLGWRRHSLSV